MILHKWVLAAVALSNQRRGHSFLHNMAQGYLAILVSFFAAEWYMRFLLAQSTTRFAALLILTAKFFVHFYRRTFHFEVTEGTF
jgi:hypothetical protein